MKTHAGRRVLALTHFFPPETGAASVRMAAVVRELVSRGYDVTVVTAFPSFPNGIIDASFRGRFCVVERQDGVKVVRLWTYASPRLSRVDRILNWACFGASLLVYMIFSREHFDLVYTTVGPVSLMPLAAFAKVLFRAPLVADVRDVYPDRALHLKLWREGGPTTRLVGYLCRKFYEASDLIATVNPVCREEILTRCAHPQKVVVFPNGYDHVVPAATSTYARRNGEFVASYVGNVCMTSGVDVMLDAARHLKDDSKFRLLIIGGGNESASIRARVKREGLDNVSMLGLKTPEEAAALQLTSDVCVVPLRRDVSDTIPKKLYDALGLGRPVVVCASGAAKSFTEASGGGVCIEPENGLQLAETLRELAATPERLLEYGRAGQQYVSARYDRAELVREFADRLASLHPDSTSSTSKPAMSLGL